MDLKGLVLIFLLIYENAFTDQKKKMTIRGNEGVEKDGKN